MALITPEIFRDRFALKSDVPVDEYISTASEEIKTWVGADVYADAEKLFDGNEATSPSNLARAYKLALAERSLAMYYYYPTASLKIESGVIVKTDRSEGEGGGVIRAFENARERREGRQGFYDAALELVKPYLLVSTEPTVQEEALPHSVFVHTSLGW